MLTKTRFSFFCFTSFLFLSEEVIPDDNARVLPSEFEIYYEDGLEPLPPRGSHTLRGFHCTFHRQRHPRNQFPGRFAVNIEKYDIVSLIYATRWVSIGLNDVIAIEGIRYRLVKITNGFTDLHFKAERQAPETPTPGTICIPRTGEAAVGGSSVIFEHGDGSNHIAVSTMQLTDIQLSRPNVPWSAVGNSIPTQNRSKTRTDAKRVETDEGAELTIAGKPYTITQVVESDPKVGVVGWIEIAPSVKEVNEEK